ncbi:MAG: cytochrome c oxidase cbb3-type subunit [Blastocatellia bacterium]|jgi:mono/diheme cytochrome c family protein|nr:cytochrome c oxidase cbb3-type subunit [Blastocatellia bacterium]
MIARSKIGIAGAVGLAIILLTGCNIHLPGQPTEAERWRAPAEITDFNQLYTQNCAGCHGAGGKLGAARSLNDPLYLAFVTDDALRQAISKGRDGTNMPAFSEQAGGHLTDPQIELIVNGMRAHWSKPDDFKGVELPRYSVDGSSTATNNDIATKAPQAVDPSRGAAAYKTYCSSCHGTNGEGGSAGSIVDPNFLNLVSDQGLRTTVVVGRADIGKPDWRGNVSGHPMSAQEINDVVAWLAARRQRTNVTVSKVDQSAWLNMK